MKRNLSVFLVLLNIFLSKSLTSLATTNEKDVDKNSATIVSEVEKSDAENIEEQKEEKGEKTKVEEKNNDKTVGDTEKKKETISIEISAGTIEKIKKMLSSETSEKCTKTRLAIETIFSVLLGVELLCSVKNQCFGTAEPVMAENIQEKSWFRSTFNFTKNAFFKVSDKILNGLPFYLIFKYI